MATFAQGSFIIPEGTTPDMLRAKRERLAALMPRYGQAKYVGEGLGQLFSGIAQGRQNRAMDAYEGEQRKAAADMFNSRGPLSVLGMQPPAGPNQDIADEALAAIGADGLPGSLVQSESGGNWGALNSEGYGGRGQFGTDRLADAARAGVIPAGMTGEAYSRAPKHVQLAVENWHKRDVLNNLGQYVGVDVDGPGPIPPLTEDSLLAVAHLGGQGGARRFIESGGQYNPSDSNGTSLADYATRHAGGGTMSAQSRTGGADVSYLMQLAANPWLTQEQRAVVNAELQQATKQPETQFVKGIGLIDSQTGRVINDFGGNGGGTESTEYGLQPQYGVDDQGNPVIIQIGKDGTATRTALPEGVTFQKEPIRIDGGTEWILLDPISRQPVGRIPKQLREAAAETAGGRIEGENAANAASNLSGNLAQADQSIALIDSIISDPALAGITGMVQGRLPPMTQAGTDLNVKIKQLQGKAFLEAFESLKGGGAITEREGVAATEAMARLDRAQSTAEYVAALTELRNIMQTGAERARASAGQSGTTPAATTGLTDDDMQWLGGN